MPNSLGLVTFDIWWWYFFIMMSSQRLLQISNHFHFSLSARLLRRNGGSRERAVRETLGGSWWLGALMTKRRRGRWWHQRGWWRHHGGSVWQRGRWPLGRFAQPRGCDVKSFSLLTNISSESPANSLSKGPISSYSLLCWSSRAASTPQQANEQLLLPAAGQTLDPIKTDRSRAGLQQNCKCSTLKIRRCHSKYRFGRPILCC